MDCKEFSNLLDACVNGTLSDAEAALRVPIRTFSDGTEFISCVFEE